MDADSVEAIERAWRRERPDVDSSSIAIATRIRRLARFLDLDRQTALAAIGIDAGTLDALATLRRSGRPYRLTAGELQRRSLVTAGAITQRLDNLEAAGLVRRERDAADKRVVHVLLTPRGRRLVDRAFVELMRREQALLTQFTTRERAVLEELLKRWLGWFERDGEPAARKFTASRRRGPGMSPSPSPSREPR